VSRCVSELLWLSTVKPAPPLTPPPLQTTVSSRQVASPPPHPSRGLAGPAGKPDYSSSSVLQQLPPLFPSAHATPSVYTASAWLPVSGRGSPSSSVPKASYSTFPPGPGQQHQPQLGPGRGERGREDQTGGVLKRSSCGSSHVAAFQLQPPPGCCSSPFRRLRRSQRPAVPTRRPQLRLPARCGP
jgi:hypothetical protein